MMSILLWQLVNSNTQMILYFRVTNLKLKNKVLLRVTNSKIKVLFFYFRFTNWRLKIKKLHFELLTRSRKKKITLRVINSWSKNCFELLT